MTWQQACWMSLNYMADRRDEQGFLWTVYLSGKGYHHRDQLVATNLTPRDLEASPDDWVPQIPLDAITSLARLSPAYQDHRPGAPSRSQSPYS